MKSTVNPYMSAVRTMLETDVKYGYTEDLASLRYAQNIKVFIWDDLKDFSTLQEVAGFKPAELADNRNNMYYSATTQKKFLPWYSLDVKDTYQAYCLEEEEDCCFMVLEPHTLAKPLPLQGILFDCSIELLRELDIFYENQDSYSRQLVDIRTQPNSLVTTQAFAWFNEIDQLADLRNDCEYHLKDHIDVTPLNTKSNASTGNEEVYVF